MENLETVLLSALDEALSNVHTMVVAKVTKVNGKTINAQPVINRVVDGKSIPLPEFIEIPLLTLQGGSSYIHYPITEGDYCLLLVSERSFDKWYHGKDNDTVIDTAMFDYSDCFAIVGINPLSKAIQIPTTTTMQGDVIQIGDYTHTGNREQTGDFTQTGDYTINGNQTINGNLVVNGNITCTGILTVPTIVCSGGASIGGIPFGTHTHNYTDNGTTLSTQVPK